MRLALALAVAFAQGAPAEAFDALLSGQPRIDATGNLKLPYGAGFLTLGQVPTSGASAMRVLPAQMPAISGDVACPIGNPLACVLQSYNGLPLENQLLPHVANNAALAAYAKPYLRVVRDSFAALGDSTPIEYTHTSSACSRVDNGLQIAGADGNCWIAANINRQVADVRIWGAKGDDVTNDGQAISNALFALLTLGGGNAYLTPTGTAYRIATGIVQPGNGTKLIGAGVPTWPGIQATAAATKAGFLARGSWLDCADTTNPCVKFTGSGDVDGVNFYWDQPQPSATAGTTWTPTAYPYAIQFTQQFSHARNIFFADAYQGLDFEYPANANIAGTYSGFEHIFGGAFKNFVRIKSANDTMHCQDIHDRTMWNVGNPNMMAYQLANEIGWDIEYWDNPQCEGIEFYKDAQAMYFADASAVYGSTAITHASEHFQFTNVLFNLVAQAINLQYGNTQVSGRFTNVLAQSDTDTNVAAPYFFNLASDYADVSFDGLEVPTVGYSLFKVGGGTSGKLRVTGLHVGNPLLSGSGAGGYGYIQPGNTGIHAFILAAGSKLDLPGGTQSITSATTGAITGCASANNCGYVLPLTAAVTPTSP